MQKGVGWLRCFPLPAALTKLFAMLHTLPQQSCAVGQTCHFLNHKTPLTLPPPPARTGCGRFIDDGDFGFLLRGLTRSGSGFRPGASHLNQLGIGKLCTIWGAKTRAAVLHASPSSSSGPSSLLVSEHTELTRLVQKQHKKTRGGSHGGLDQRCIAHKNSHSALFAL